MWTHFKQSDLLIRPGINQISIQGNALSKDSELTKEKISALQLSLLDIAETELDHGIQNDWSAPIRIVLEANPDCNPNMFFNILSQISREEYLFLEEALLEMITHVHQLRKEMQDLFSINAPKIRDLKRKLKLLKASLFKLMDSSKGISIKEVMLSDRILAIEYELNNLQYNRKYSELSNTKAHAKVFPTDRLNDSELSSLTKLGILKVVRFPLHQENVVIIADKNDLQTFDSSDKLQYGFSELGLKFIEACTGKTL